MPRKASGSSSGLPKLVASDASVSKLNQYVEKVGVEQAVAELSSSGLLERAVAKGAGALLESLIRLGVDVDGRPNKPEDVMWVFENPNALTRLVLGLTTFEGDTITQWFTRLLAAGARPDQLHPDLRIVNPAHRDRAHSVCDFAAMVGRFDLLEPLLSRVEENDVETRASAMVAALRAVPTSVLHSRLSPGSKLSVGVLYAADYLRRDAFVRLLELGLPRVGTSRWGLTVPHAAVLASDPEIFELLVEGHSAALGATVPAPVIVKDANFPSGKVVNLALGATLTDMASAALELLRVSLATAVPGHWGDALRARVAGLERIAERLAELGVGAGASELAVDAAHKPIYDALRSWLGDGPVRAAAATIDTSTTPWLCFVRLAEALAPALRERLEPVADSHVIAYVACERHRAPPTPLDLEDWRSFGYEEPNKWQKVDPGDYTEPGRAVLENGRLLGRRGDALLCTSDINGGHLWEIWPERAVDHGDTVSLVTSLSALLARPS